jgi:hypothetical protein
MATVLALHFTGIWALTDVVDNFGAYLTTAILAGDLFSVFW